MILLVPILNGTIRKYIKGIFDLRIKGTFSEHTLANVKLYSADRKSANPKINKPFDSKDHSF